MSSKKSALVFIHGFLSGPEYWHKQLSDLADTFCILPVCLKGFSHRNQELAPTSIAGFAEDVIQQLDTQKVDSFFLVGHSMGGMIAQEVVHKIPHRINGLVLYGTGPYGSLPGRFEPIEQSLKNASPDGFRASIEKAVKSWFLDEIASQHDIEDSLLLAMKAPFSSYKHGLVAMSNWEGKSYLSRFKMPTLVLWGDTDRSYQWESQPYTLWKSIENSSLSVVSNSAHNVHLENPELFNLILTTFLARLPPATAAKP